jgi:hypothetical protein
MSTFGKKKNLFAQMGLPQQSDNNSGASPYFNKTYASNSLIRLDTFKENASDD